MSEFSVIFNVLLLSTSAFFAVSQYYENRQTRLIEEEQKKLETYNLSLADSNTGMSDVKHRWDELRVIRPINNNYIIVIVFSLLVIYTFVFAIGMIGGWCAGEYHLMVCNIINHILRFLSIIVFVMGVCLFVNWIKMKNQLEKFTKDIGSFDILYKTVNKAIDHKKL